MGKQLPKVDGSSILTFPLQICSTEKAWQRIIREKKELEYKKAPTDFVEISKAVCAPISYDLAKTIILEYEWLGTMGQGMYCYGIFFNNILAGAVCFGLPASLTAGDICGKEYRKVSICLERGACVWWAHPHSASKLISYAVKHLSKTTQYRLFFAYSDESAGEIGTVYQACGWHYIGKMVSGGSQNKLITPSGVMKDSRHIMTYAKKFQSEIKNRTEARKILESNGWKSFKTKPKSKYFCLKGSEKEVSDLMKNLKFNIEPYPKRIQPKEIK